MTEGSYYTRTEHVSDFGSWSLYRRAPSIRISPYVCMLTGYSETGGQRVVRKEIPSSVIPMILNFGPAFDLYEREGNRALDRSFIAGLHETYSIVGSGGNALCMQVDFTPAGARRFLGIDMSELRGRVIDLNAILSEEADRLEQKLFEVSGWRERFDILEDFLWHRLSRASEGSFLVQSAWQHIIRNGGDIKTGELAKIHNVSRKHLASLFHREIGLSPKSFARVVRFERAVARLQEGGFTSLAELAVFSGYSDQSHFNHDFHKFTGETPTALSARIAADGSGIMVQSR